MVPIGRTTTLQERLTILERSEAGAKDAAIAEELGISVWTVRKWRRRGQHQGRAGLVSRMGRPKGGALSSFPPEVRQAVDALRDEHPGWGPLTILTELKADTRFSGVES